MKTTAVEQMRRRATAAVRARLYATSGTRFLVGKIRPRALVLVYHRLGEPAFDPFGQAVSSGNFARHLTTLRSNYRLETVHGLLDALREHAVEDGTVVVTFDDGYADVLQSAAPIAAERGAPLHLFVTVQSVVDGTRFWWDRLAAAVLGSDTGEQNLALGNLRLQLDDGPSRTAAYQAVHTRLKRLPPEERERKLEEVFSQVPEREDIDLGRPLTPAELSTFVSTPGMEIGAHTLSHPALGALPGEEQRRELAESRHTLQELTGRAADTVAYPFGKAADINAETPRIAADVGYVAGFTTIAELVTNRANPLLLPRLTVHDWPEDVFRSRLNTIFGF
jgi:peptidoglycan/xylan/chitin deacetylase (PgdA/CDA1 family)